MGLLVAKCTKQLRNEEKSERCVLTRSRIDNGLNAGSNSSFRLFGDVIFRMSSIHLLGGISILPSGKACFEGNVCAMVKKTK